MGGNGKRRPSSDGDNGRNADGKFGEGNSFGKGNPEFKWRSSLNAHLRNCVTLKDVESAWSTLRSIMEDEDQPAKTRVSAAQAMLDRALGKASQVVEMTGDVQFTVAEFYRALTDRCLQRS